MEDNQASDERPHPISPLVTPRRDALSEYEKAEALADNLKARFQAVKDSSVSAIIETVDMATRSYFLSPARETKLTNPNDIHEAISGLKVSKADGPNGIPKTALNIFQASGYPPRSSDLSLSTARKDPALPSSYTGH
jgi:hypothetical protein